MRSTFRNFVHWFISVVFGIDSVFVYLLLQPVARHLHSLFDSSVSFSCYIYTYSKNITQWVVYNARWCHVMNAKSLINCSKRYATQMSRVDQLWLLAEGGRGAKLFTWPILKTWAPGGDVSPLCFPYFPSLPFLSPFTYPPPSPSRHDYVCVPGERALHFSSKLLHLAQKVFRYLEPFRGNSRVW